MLLHRVMGVGCGVLLGSAFGFLLGFVPDRFDVSRVVLSAVPISPSLRPRDEQRAVREPSEKDVEAMSMSLTRRFEHHNFLKIDDAVVLKSTFPSRRRRFDIVSPCFRPRSLPKLSLSFCLLSRELWTLFIPTTVSHPLLTYLYPRCSAALLLCSRSVLMGTSWYFPPQPHAISLRTVLLGSVGLFAMLGFAVIGFFGGGPVACIVAAWVSSWGWRKQGWGPDYVSSTARTASTAPRP